MIRYTLRCRDGHAFESWFQSADAFQALADQGHLSCAVCGIEEVSKAPMAPQVQAARGRTKPGDSLTEAPAPQESAPLAKLREAVEMNSDYVGRSFASEARKIHSGEAPERAIHGEAKANEAKALLEDGIPVLPLPFTPKSRTN